MEEKYDDILKLRPEEEVLVLFRDGEVDFSWYSWEMEKAVELWIKGFSFSEMVHKLRPRVASYVRTQEEHDLDVFFLLMYLSYCKRLPGSKKRLWAGLKKDDTKKEKKAKKGGTP